MYFALYFMLKYLRIKQKKKYRIKIEKNLKNVLTLWENDDTIALVCVVRNEFEPHAVTDFIIFKGGAVNANI